MKNTKIKGISFCLFSISRCVGKWKNIKIGLIKTSPRPGFLFYPIASGSGRQGVNESQRKQGGANRKPFQTCQTAGAHKQRHDQSNDRRRHRSAPFHQINIFLLFPYCHHTTPPQKVNKKQSTGGQDKKAQESAKFAPIFQICPHFFKFAPSVNASNPAEIWEIYPIHPIHPIT